MRSKFYSFHIVALFLHFLPLSTSGNVGGTKAVKEEAWPSAKNILLENNGTSERKPFHNIPFSGNSNIDSKSDKRIRKSIDKSIMISTKQSIESDTTLIPAFMNCFHSSVEPGRYVKFSNGSVYVPEFKIFLNTSSYIIIYGILYYCPEFLYPDDYFAENKATEKIQSLKSDNTDSQVDLNQTRGRFRRARDYLLSDTPTDETSTITTDVPVLSSKFTNCIKKRLGRTKYEKLSNGSVFVPSYNKLFNSSDYVLKWNVLIVCENAPNNTVPEKPTNFSSGGPVFSPIFKNCPKTRLNRTKYEKLSNGSVFVPSYNKVFNSSDYVLKWNVLIVCENTPPKNNITILEEGNTESNTNFSSDTSDPCIPNSENDEGRIRRAVHYEFDNITTTISSLETEIDYSILSPEYLNCSAHISVEPGCYDKRPDGSVYSPVYKRVFDKSNYIIRHETLIICPSFFPIEEEAKKFSKSIEIVSFTCTIISTICILLHIIMFILVKKLRNLPGYCLLSLCIALVNAYICTFVQIHISDYTACTVLGMCLVYFFLASFFWMNVMAYDVWKSIRMATSKLRTTSGRPIIVQFARYSLYAWGTPLLILLLSIIVHFSVREDSKYRLTFNLSNCFFTFKQALTLYFAGPIFSLIGMNVLFFCSSFFMISNAAMSNSHTAGTQSNSDLWSRFFLALRLSSVMGFMWIFGIIAAVTKLPWMWHLYSAFSALQGVFIFASFSLNERTRKVCLKTLRERTCSISPTQSSSQQTTSISQKNENEQCV